VSYSLYRLLTILLSPLINIFIFLRLICGKEDFKRYFERFAKASVARPEGGIIWVQSVSVGESVAALTLINKLLEIKSISVLLTTTSKTSAELIAKKIKDNPRIIHQYSPIDKYSTIIKFLKYWKPLLFINIESEIWPNQIYLSNILSGRVVIASAKMSDKSFKRWNKFSKMRDAIFPLIKVCYPQSEEDDKRFKKLGVKETVMIGNLKLSSPKLSINQGYLNNLKDKIKERKIILFASIHVEEIEKVCDTYLKIKEQENQNLFSIFAIRHPNKSNEIYNFLNSKGLKVKRKSKNETIEDNTDIYMYDEMGEMGTLYEISEIVVLCGSFVDGIGGHNPVEITGFNCAIVTAPYITNNKNLFNELVINDACIVNEGNDVVGEMSNVIIELLNNKGKINKLKDNALNLSNKYLHIVDNMVDDIFDRLN
jgi:3-deoxy-D-manno-octulosonic-acid transferase